MPWASMNPYAFWLIVGPLLVLFACVVSALIEWRQGR